MNPVVRRLMRAGNAAAVSLYRRSGGRVGGKARGGVPVLLLTVAGRRSGQPHTHPVGWFEHDGGWLVVGSGGGMAAEPQWFRNLRRAPTASVELGRERHDVAVRVLQGEERDRLWGEVVIARVPSFAKYEAKTTRTIPIAHLTPRTSVG